MRATKGFTKMDRKTLFELFDRNGKIYFCNVTRSLMLQGLSSLFPGQVKHIHFFLGDKFIGVYEFRSVPQSIRSAGILDHCFRTKMVKGGCIGIGWGSRLQQSVLNSPSNELRAQSLEKLTVETQPSIAG